MKVSEIPELASRLREIPGCDVDIRFEADRSVDNFFVQLSKEGEDVFTPWVDLYNYDIDQSVDLCRALFEDMLEWLVEHN